MDSAHGSAQAEALVGSMTFRNPQPSAHRCIATPTPTHATQSPFNPRKLNPEYRSDQKDPLMFHPNEVARFAKDVLRIKEVTLRC